MSHPAFTLKERVLVAVETECCLVVEAGSCPRRSLRTWPLSSGTSKHASPWQPVADRLKLKAGNCE